VASMSIWSKFTGKERVVAVAVSDGGRGRVFCRVTSPRAERPGELIVSPFEVPDLALDGASVAGLIEEEVGRGPALLRLEVLNGGGRLVSKRVWVEATGGHPRLAFGGSLTELGWQESCPLGTGAEVYERLMGSSSPAGGRML
jgi:hypothetical protein